MSGRASPLCSDKKQPHPAPGDLDERGKSRFEAVFPLLGEAQPLVPNDRRRSVLDAKNGNDFFVHGVIVADRPG